MVMNRTMDAVWEIYNIESCGAFHINSSKSNFDLIPHNLFFEPEHEIFQQETVVTFRAASRNTWLTSAFSRILKWIGHSIKKNRRVTKETKCNPNQQNQCSVVHNIFDVECLMLMLKALYLHLQTEDRELVNKLEPERFKSFHFPERKWCERLPTSLVGSSPSPACHQHFNSNSPESPVLLNETWQVSI